MVGKAKSIGHTSNAVDYGKDKPNSQEISRNKLIGNSGYDIEQEFKVYQNLNSNAKFNTISVVLSPDPKDGRRLTNADYKEITNSYLEKMNLQENQHIAYVHRDRDHTHIHVYINRIDDKGKAYNDSFISKKTQHIVAEIAKEKGLISARDKMYQNINKQNSHLKEIKTEIFKKHQTVLKNNPGTFSKYKDEMKKLGLEVKPTINKQGEIQGFRIIDTETKNDFKASEINRSMSVGNLIKSGLKNDLNNQLNSPLKTTAKKQNLGLEHQLKRTINSKSKSKNFGKEKGKFTLGKEKLTLKQRIEYSKVEDMMVDNINIKHQEYWNDQPKFEELKQQLENKNLNKDNER
ncbi:TPA: relaxase/mobilization nuclease domain-containing protein [Flavobacterium psychrophilum]|uniref:relaxase/mobilization nuclease domain-containing protein n=2 Tax=Flavobacterium psychrophilum TaxID=96345 RepID=UPI002A6270FF|nr:relaxase/mobilization nuclease domain-containing protein [Flavobacterium psychrophilum]MEB3378524.1 relaxase/mobilization nuclease domain-containing protein [Flavobacterium psychrophilum]